MHDSVVHRDHQNYLFGILLFVLKGTAMGGLSQARFACHMFSACTGAAVALLVVTESWQLYVPAFVVAALIALASVLLLARQLPVWSIVDGLRASSGRNVNTGTVNDEVTATTDVAIRALDASLVALNDQGELQSCVFWRELVPRRAGEIMSASGGLYEVLGDGLTGRLNPMVRSFSGLF